MPYRIPLMYRRPGDPGYFPMPDAGVLAPPAPPAWVEPVTPWPPQPATPPRAAAAAPSDPPPATVPPDSAPAPSAPAERPPAPVSATTADHPAAPSPRSNPATAEPPAPAAAAAPEPGPTAAQTTPPAPTARRGRRARTPGVAAPAPTARAAAKTPPPTQAPRRPRRSAASAAPPPPPPAAPLPPAPAPGPAPHPASPAPPVTAPAPAKAAVPRALDNPHTGPAQRLELSWAEMRARTHFGVEHVAEWLTERTALLPLSEAQAQLVAQHTRPLVLSAGRLHPPLGEPVLRAEELLLILRGRVSAALPLESPALAWAEVAQLPDRAAGDFLGETAFLDARDTAREVLLHAQSEVAAAVLSRQALQSLAHDQPEVAARLMAALTLALAHETRTAHHHLTRATQLLRASPGATPDPLPALARG